MPVCDAERAERGRDLYESWRSYALGMDEFWRMKQENAEAGARLGAHVLGPWFAGVARHAAFERRIVARLRLLMLLRARAMGAFWHGSAPDSSESSPKGRP